MFPDLFTMQFYITTFIKSVEIVLTSFFLIDYMFNQQFIDG